MARPRKNGFDYFPFDVDFFRNIKIRITLIRYGASGVLLFIYLLALIYSNGYYVEYNEDLLDVIENDLQMTPKKTSQIINFFCKRSLFDNKLFTTDKIITSEGIQRRFQYMVKERAMHRPDKTVYVNERLWLLKKEETATFVQVHPSDDFSFESNSYSEKNNSYSEKNGTKESKVKESKEKESKVCCGYSIPCKNGSFDITKKFLDELTHTYPEMDVEKALSKMCIYLKGYPEKQGYISGAKSRVELWLRDDNERGKYRRPKQQGAYDLSEYESWSVIDEMDETDEDKTSQK